MRERIFVARSHRKALKLRKRVRRTNRRKIMRERESYLLSQIIKLNGLLELEISTLYWRFCACYGVKIRRKRFESWVYRLKREKCNVGDE